MSFLQGAGQQGGQGTFQQGGGAFQQPVGSQFAGVQTGFGTGAGSGFQQAGGQQFQQPVGSQFAGVQTGFGTSADAFQQPAWGQQFQQQPSSFQQQTGAGQSFAQYGPPSYGPFYGGPSFGTSGQGIVGSTPGGTFQQTSGQTMSQRPQEQQQTAAFGTSMQSVAGPMAGAAFSGQQGQGAGAGQQQQSFAQYAPTAGAGQQAFTPIQSGYQQSFGQYAPQTQKPASDREAGSSYGSQRGDTKGDIAGASRGDVKGQVTDWGAAAVFASQRPADPGAAFAGWAESKAGETASQRLGGNTSYQNSIPIKGLTPDQENHIARLTALLEIPGNNGVFDVTRTGGGKTFSSLAAVQRTNSAYAVLAPAAVVPEWKTVINEFKLPPPIMIASIEGQREGATRALKFVEEGWTDQGARRQLAPSIIAAAYGGVNVVIMMDEAHQGNVGTITSNIRAEIAQLARQWNQRNAKEIAAKQRGRIQIIFMSATLFDKPEKSINVPYIMGITQLKQQYAGRGRYQNTTAMVVTDADNRMDAENLDAFRAEIQDILSNKERRAMIGEGNAKWLEEKAMPILTNPSQYFNNDQKGAVTLEILGASLIPASTAYLAVKSVGKYANLLVMHDTEHDYKLALKGIHEFNAVTVFQDSEGKAALGRLTAAMEFLENSKAKLFYRVALDAINKNPKSKVLIFAYYHSTLALVNKFLEDAIRIGVIKGLKSSQIMPFVGPRQAGSDSPFPGHDAEGRKRLAAEFNAPTDYYRVGLMSESVSSVGLSFHDRSKGGEWPRTSIVSPILNMTMTIQAMGRTDRLGTTSIPTVYLVYTQARELELRLMRGVTNKSSVISGIRARVNPINASGIESGVDVEAKLPNEYDYIVEEWQGPDKIGGLDADAKTLSQRAAGAHGGRFPYEAGSAHIPKVIRNVMGYYGAPAREIETAVNAFMRDTGGAYNAEAIVEDAGAGDLFGAGAAAGEVVSGGGAGAAAPKSGARGAAPKRGARGAGAAGSQRGAGAQEYKAPAPRGAGALIEFGTPAAALAQQFGSFQQAAPVQQQYQQAAPVQQQFQSFYQPLQPVAQQRVEYKAPVQQQQFQQAPVQQQQFQQAPVQQQQFWPVQRFAPAEIQQQFQPAGQQVPFGSQPAQPFQPARAPSPARAASAAAPPAAAPAGGAGGMSVNDILASALYGEP